MQRAILALTCAVPALTIGAAAQGTASDATCGRTGSSNPGVITGVVSAAASRAALDSAVVMAQWIQLANKSRDFTPASRPASVDGARFRLCGLPLNAPIRLKVARRGYRDVEGEVVVPATGVLQRDFQLVESSASDGAGVIAGRILTPDGRAVESGKVTIRALGRDVRIVDGHFAMSGLPVGTWPLLVRAIGYSSRTIVVDAIAGTAPPLTVTLNEAAHEVEGMTITALSNMDLKTMREVMARKKVGFGTFFLPGDRRLDRALRLSDLANYAAGLHVRNDGVIEGRAVGSLNQPGRCVPTIYIDGVRDSLEMPMGDVLAVAMFPDMTGVPVEYRDPRNCAVILVWMKR